MGLNSSTNLGCVVAEVWFRWEISFEFWTLGGRASEARDSYFLHFEGLTHFLTLSIKIKISYI